MPKGDGGPSEAERAYAAAAATLGSLTSDRLFSRQREAGVGPPPRDALLSGGASPPPTWHSPSPVEWLRDQEGEVDDGDPMECSDEDADEAFAADDDEEVVENPLYSTPAPKRTVRPGEAAGELNATQRAQTPVMSNESKNRYGQPLPVTTPLHPSSSAMSALSAARPLPPGASAVPVSATSTATYRRYHDALQLFCRRRRTLMMDGLESWDPDCLLRVDLEYLRALHTTGWEIQAHAASPSETARIPRQFTRSQKEGNFWSLLRHLRSLGPEAVWWQDTPNRQAEGRHFLKGLLDDPDLLEKHTPCSLLAQLNDPKKMAAVASLPLVLQRRRTLLRWMEKCFDGLVPPRSAWPLPGEVLYRQSDLPGTTRDRDLFSTALALVLAGRLDDAQGLARDAGTPWRAAAWGGAEPHGRAVAAAGPGSGSTKSSPSSVGNPHRALWRRAMWKQAEHLNPHWTDEAPPTVPKNSPATTAEEGALVALLACHVSAAVSNPSLRTWEKGLYATLRSVWERTEDELLHRFHEAARANRVALPSAECAAQERDHLRATADIRDLNETDIVKQLAASPFPEMTSHDIATEATASVVVGQDWILSFLQSCLEREEVSHDVQALRFLTHAVLYLHGLYLEGPAPSPAMADLLEDWKDSLLQAYLAHLSSRGSLSGLLVLYASLLPHDTVVAVFPPLLCSVEHPGERQAIVGQLGEYLPSVELAVLRRVVELAMPPPPTIERSASCVSPASVGFGAAHGTPTQAEVRQMKSVLWLCVNPAHSASAVVFANKLLRRFLLDGKVGSAVMFLADILPPELGGGGSDAQDNMDAATTPTEAADDDELMDATFADALSEHVALQAYIAVLKAVDHFRDVLDSADAQPGLVDDAIDPTHLDATEASIAKLAERRQLIKEKRKSSSAVVVAANQAVKSLLAILKHPGGWLLTDDEETQGKESEQTRKSQLLALRSQVLPGVALLWTQACMETAAWMALSLQDATARLGDSPESALADLDSDAQESPLAPGFWSAKALEIAPYVTSDQFGVRSALTEQNIKDLLSQLGDATVQHLKYTSPWSSSITTTNDNTDR